MDDQAKSAFSAATEVVKNVLTLSSAVLTVSIAFAKDINKCPSNFETWVLEASWIFLLTGAVSGVVTLMAITGSLSKAQDPMATTLYENNIRIPMGVASIAFLLGVTLTAVFGMLSV